jgi:hypothetical protein
VPHSGICFLKIAIPVFEDQQQYAHQVCNIKRREALLQKLGEWPWSLYVRFTQNRMSLWNSLSKRWHWIYIFRSLEALGKFMGQINIGILKEVWIYQ